MHGMVALVFVQLLSTLAYMETLFLITNKLWYAHIAFIDVCMFVHVSHHDVHVHVHVLATSSCMCALCHKMYIPYIRKIWRCLNLAILPPSGPYKILAKF